MEKNSQFDQVLKERLRKIENILGKKAKEYAKNDDRYHNFNVAARIRNSTPEEALLGMMMKHIVSVMDLIEDPKSATFELIDEKIGDNINYLILLEGMMKKQMGIFETIKAFDYVCNYCNQPGLPSTFVLVTGGVKLEGDVKIGLCTTCANRMRADNKAYVTVGNEISNRGVIG